MCHRLLLAVFTLLLSVFLIPVFGQDQYSFTSTADATRFQSLTQQIRCVVCQGQSLAESNAPLAADLRTKIYQMIVTNKSDAEIKAFMVKRYGEWALLQPQFNRFTAFLWVFPWLGLGVVVSCFCLSPKARPE